MRLLAIDPGEKMLGVAISDPSGTIARPLTSLRHESREKDAGRIVALAGEHEAETIVLGLALDTEGQVGPQARRAERLADAIRLLTAIPVLLHDESYSTQTAEQARRGSKKARARRAHREQIHAVAAAAILQSYLDAHPIREA